MPPPIDQQVTFFYTADLAATTDFYERIVGLPLVLDQGQCRIYRVASGAFVGFCTSQGATVNTDDVIFTFVTPAVDDWHTYLTAHNVSIEKAPSLNETYNVYHLFVRDPNGYLLEFQTFRDPAWPNPDR